MIGACIQSCANGISFETPSAPWVCMARHTISFSNFGVATLTPAISARAAWPPRNASAAEVADGAAGCHRSSMEARTLRKVDDSGAVARAQRAEREEPRAACAAAGSEAEGVAVGVVTSVEA